MPFTEEDFRKRKPHPNYKDHLAAEKTVIKYGKTNKKKLATYVVCSGLIYGQEENIFHYLFKAAWHNQDLTLYGNGKNTLPTIHINDLAGYFEPLSKHESIILILYNINSVMQSLADQKPKVRYLVAVDDSKSTLKQITKAVSRKLGTGKHKVMSKEDALLNKEITVNITQIEINIPLLNLKL